ncbi:MAG TPA: hypothetical protein VGU20_31085 [Stellaceae bacterium]|nr:hypothetical protein [Terriglobia bacterium]HEV2551796.1 hypothetical protein [Stellaceae bacterium]
MTVTANPRDNDGRQLASHVSSLQTAVNAASGKAHYPALSAQLDQAQRELVAHYLDVGRLTAANILSTMT